MGISIPVFVGVLLVLLSICKFIIYPTFLSPLSKIPNAHPTSAISPAWILWIRYTNRNNRTIQAAHEKFGPVIRVAPNEVSVNCVDDGIRTIYAGGFEKHEWYPNLFGAYGKLNMFTMIHSKPHSVRKRMLSNIYSKSYLQSSPHAQAVSAAIVGKRYLPQIQHAADSGCPIDVHEINNALTMDLVSAYQFGLKNSTNLLENAETRTHILKLYRRRKPYEFFSQEIPKLTEWCHKVGVHLIPKWVTTASAELQDWCMDMVMGADDFVSSHPYAADVDPGDEPNVYRQFKLAFLKSTSDSEKGDGIHAPLSEQQQREVAAEMYDHMTAGNETSAIALTYVYWELSQHVNLQAALRKELLSLARPIRFPVDEGETISFPEPKDIDSLPLLHAVLMETLRLHAPVPGHQPRITPSTPTTLGTYKGLPPNVRVSAMAHTLHRNPEVFPDPDKWVPQRWLESEETGGNLDEMKRWFWAFGSGGRMCIGSNLAMQEMKTTIAALYTNFTSSIADDRGIEQQDAFTAQPKGFKLTLNFEHV